jgi:hypothetical protein
MVFAFSKHIFLSAITNIVLHPLRELLTSAKPIKDGIANRLLSYNIILSVSVDIHAKGVNANWKGLYIKAVWYYISSN